MALRCITSTISSGKLDDAWSVLFVFSHGLTDSHGVDGGDGVFRQFSCDPIAPHKLFIASNEMAMRWGILKSQIIPEPDDDNEKEERNY